MLELAAAKIQRVFHSPVDCIGTLLPYDVNAGFVIPNDRHTSSREMMQLAEGALRLAISTNESFVIVEPGEDAQEKPDPSLVPKIEQAVERGEFVLFYQPKISAAYGTVIGAEGLVRWLDPRKKKVIPPGLFIEAAEQSAVIVPLTEFLIRSAVSTCSEWDESVGIAINVPPKLLEKDTLLSVVSDALDFYAISPGRLTLEITERGELPSSAFQYLEGMREMGVKIAIDDFGTGQCSLMYFRDLPADEVKIDQAFVSRMRSSKKDRAIVEGIIQLSHLCEMTVVAEGIEDEKTAALLTELKCDTLQGYHYGKPVDGETFAEKHLNKLQSPESGGYFSRLLG